MKNFKIIIPIEGVFDTSIYADNVKEALQILLDKQEQLEYYPYGHIKLKLDSVIITENDDKQIS